MDADTQEQFRRVRAEMNSFATAMGRALAVIAESDEQMAELDGVIAIFETMPGAGEMVQHLRDAADEALAIRRAAREGPRRPR